MGSVVLRQVTIAVAQVLDTLLSAYSLVLIVSVLLSWVNPDPYNPIVRFIRGVTEPVLSGVRRALPFVVIGGIDLSPIVVILGIGVVRTVVVESLYGLAHELAAAGTRLVVG